MLSNGLHFSSRNLNGLKVANANSAGICQSAEDEGQEQIQAWIIRQLFQWKRKKYPRSLFYFIEIGF